jgi:hypothetical protein
MAGTEARRFYLDTFRATSSISFLSFASARLNSLTKSSCFRDPLRNRHTAQS